MNPSRTSTRIAFALIVFRAIVTFICLMSIVACISAIAHGARFEQQDTPGSSTALKPRSAPTTTRGTKPINNPIIYPNKTSPSSPSSSSSSSTQITTPLSSSTKNLCEQLFFQYLTLFILSVWLALTILKDWPFGRSWLYRPSELVATSGDQDQGQQGKGGGYGNELKVGYSLPSIGASLVTIGSTMLAMNLGSNPLWRFFSWQTSLMDGFGYATFGVGIIYIILGVGPWELRQCRDETQSP